MGDREDSIDPATATAAGLDLFAAAWLEKWTANGGSVIVEPTGKAWIGRPEYSFSRAYVEPSSELPAEVRDRQDTYRHAAYDGEMRGLFDLLNMVPGGRQAVKSHVLTFPANISADGWRATA